MIEIVDPTGDRVPGPGLYRMPAAVYHADPCAEPSLSSGIARTLLDQTPRHAYAKHPRLGGTAEDPRSRKLDLGSIAHELLTGHGKGIHVISATNKAGEPVENYLTKAAQEERDTAVAAGLTPVLPCDLSRAERMVKAVQSRLDSIPGARGAFWAGVGETVAVWRDPAGPWGRAMLDWIGPTPFEVWDLKTTSAGLSDRALATKIDEGLDLQAAWYARGLMRLEPELAGRLRFRFVFVEACEPFECRVIELDGEQRHRGERKAVTAAVLFQDCLSRGVWPGYPPEISRVESRPWVTTAWEEREIADPLLRGLGSKLLLAHSPFAPDQGAAA